MIATVTLLRRMPARTDGFDYAIPEEMHVSCGALVSVPYRRGTELGVITSIQETSSFAVKPIERVICDVIVTETDIMLMHAIATEYHVSLSTALLLFTPPFPKKNPESMAINPHRVSPNNPTVTLITYKSDADREAYIETLTTPGVHLIVVPTFEYPITIPTKTPKEKKKAHLMAVGLENGILMGTRSTLFLPITHLASITIIDEEHSGHKSWESNPRYHSTEIAYLISQLRGVPLTLLSRFPRVETAFSPIITKKRTLESSTTLVLPTLSTQLSKSILSPTLHTAIERAQETGTHVVIWCASKHTPGAEGARIAIETAYPGTEKTVLIGTESIFESLDWKHVSMVILSDVPFILSIPDYRMVEGIGRLIMLCAAKLGEYSPEAEFSIMSNERTSEMLSLITSGQLTPWYASEIQARKQFNLPPYTRIIALENVVGMIPEQLEPYALAHDANRMTFAIPHQVFNEIIAVLHDNLDPRVIVDVDPLKLL